MSDVISRSMDTTIVREQNYNKELLIVIAMEGKLWLIYKIVVYATTCNEVQLRYLVFNIQWGGVIRIQVFENKKGFNIFFYLLFRGLRLKV